MRDSDEIRRRIETRLTELRLDAVQVSQELGFNRGYLHDYLRKGTPKQMPNEIKMQLARRLQLSPVDLGVTTLARTASGFADDAVPYTAGAADFPEHIALFQIRGRVLDRHPMNIVPGRLAAIDINRVDPARLAAGAVVIAQLYDRHELTRSHGTVLRQFLPPDKLVTNSSEGNDIMALDDPSRPYVAVIKGVLVYLVDSTNHDGDSHAPPS